MASYLVVLIGMVAHGHLLLGIEISSGPYDPSILHVIHGDDIGFSLKTNDGLHDQVSLEDIADSSEERLLHLVDADEDSDNSGSSEVRIGNVEDLLGHVSRGRRRFSNGLNGGGTSHWRGRGQTLGRYGHIKGIPRWIHVPGGITRRSLGVPSISVTPSWLRSDIFGAADQVLDVDGLHGYDSRVNIGHVAHLGGQVVSGHGESSRGGRVIHKLNRYGPWGWRAGRASSLNIGRVGYLGGQVTSGQGQFSRGFGGPGGQAIGNSQALGGGGQGPTKLNIGTVSQLTGQVASGQGQFSQGGGGTTQGIGSNRLLGGAFPRPYSVWNRAYPPIQPWYVPYRPYGPSGGQTLDGAGGTSNLQIGTVGTLTGQVASGKGQFSQGVGGSGGQAIGDGQALGGGGEGPTNLYIGTVSQLTGQVASGQGQFSQGGGGTTQGIGSNRLLGGAFPRPYSVWNRAYPPIQPWYVPYRPYGPSGGQTLDGAGGTSNLQIGTVGTLTGQVASGKGQFSQGGGVGQRIGSHALLGVAPKSTYYFGGNQGYIPGQPLFGPVYRGPYGPGGGQTVGGGEGTTRLQIGTVGTLTGQVASGKGQFSQGGGGSQNLGGSGLGPVLAGDQQLDAQGRGQESNLIIGSVGNLLGQVVSGQGQLKKQAGRGYGFSGVYAKPPHYHNHRYHDEESAEYIRGNERSYKRSLHEGEISTHHRKK